MTTVSRCSREGERRWMLPRQTMACALVMIAAVIPVRLVAAQAQLPIPAASYEHLDSLERTALSDTTLEVRFEAVSRIASISLGQGTCAGGLAPSAIRYPGVVSSLSSIYRRSQDDQLRREILAKMLWQAECAEAVEFLAEAASEIPEERAPRGGIVVGHERGTSQSGAVSILVAFGPLGESALRHLYDQGSVRDSVARASLEILARNGFRWPAHEATAQDRPPRPLPAHAYTRLDSLETAALTGATFRSRQHAVSTITSIGLGQGDCVRGTAPQTTEYPGLVSSLASIFRRSEDAELRRSILGLMGFQAECAEAVAFLTTVAQESPPAPPAGSFVTDEFRNTLQSDAVSLLLSFGDLGEQALRRLHSEGTVRDPFARVLLEKVATNAFERPK